MVETIIRKINWKLEGQAEYVSRQFKHDGQLVEKIEKYVLEEGKEKVGFPVIDRADGTKQIQSYYKFALVYQYLIEEKNLTYQQIYELDTDLETIYAEMIAWSKNN